MNCPRCGDQNPDTANFCAQCGRALKAITHPRSFVEWLQGGARGEGERRQVTILACDTVQSSLLAEHMDPEEFLDLMNRAFDAILCPVFDYGGYLARLEGDGFKAFFGAPEAHEDDPLRAVRAGLDIQAAARRIATELEQEGRAHDFAVRVGVHTDRVVVGPVGTNDTVEYTAMGVGIVLAARLESIAQPGTVLISEATFRLVEPYVEAVPLGPTKVKGRTQPVRVYEVTGLRITSDIDQVRGVESPLVGRTVELTMLRGALTRLLEGAGIHRGGIITLVGEAGVGKSRLMRHVRNQAVQMTPQPIWLYGRAQSRGQGAYGVLADLLHRYLGITANDRMAVMWTKLRRRMAQLFAPLPTHSSDQETIEKEAQALIPHLANLLSLHLTGDQARQVTTLDPGGQERHIFRALRRMIERLTDIGPLVLALDDLHWADEGSIRLLQDLMPLTDTRPLLLIFSFRPEPGAACWALRDLARRAHADNHTEIVLHGLSEQASNELIGNLLETSQDEGLSEAVRTLIRERSGGNPLFIEEVVRTLIDRGLLKRTDVRWQIAGQIPDNYIPETLQGVLAARLDRLDAASRQVLQVASVIGRTFSLRVLQRVVQPGIDLEAHLTRLQQAELIRAVRRGTEQEYVFVHTLTQQVAYETLLRRQRRDYHRRVARSIETLYADRLEEQYERLAYHYANAEMWPQALDYHIKFATQAQLRFANDKAAEHLEAAWQIIKAGHGGDRATQRLLHEAQGNLSALEGNYQKAAFRYEAALQLADTPADRIRLLGKLGNVCQNWGKYDQGIAYLQQGLELAQTTGQEIARGTLYIVLGQIFHRQGHFHKAVELGLQALEIFEAHDDRPGTARASNLLGIAYWAMGDLDTARTYHEKSLLIHASIGDIHGLAAAYNNLGRVLADQGELEKALRNYRQSQQLCQEIGHQHGLATALSHLSELYQQIGQTDQALACQRQAFEIYNRIGFDGLEVQPEVLKMQVW